MPAKSCALPPPVEALLARVAGGRSLLVLDYDGTLAPFHADRMAATPDPALLPALARLAAAPRVRLVVLSGRPLVELERLLALDPLPELWGVHGWEHRLPDGSRDDPPLPVSLAAVLDAEQHHLAALDPERLERKVATLALHWRGVDAADARALEEQVAPRWRDLAATEPALELRRFDGGLELRAAGRDKGRAMRELIASEPGGTPSCYVGDDDTDEDAFRALASLDEPTVALGVLVAAEARPTAAGARIPPAAVRLLLERWAAAAGAAEADAS
jgi:trehalose 6-phosphate phosphatase